MIEILQNFFSEHPRCLEWAAIPLDDPPDGKLLEEWIDQGLHADMGFMEKSLQERLHPDRYVPWAKSMVIFLWSWPVPLLARHEKEIKVSAYVGERDYHHEIRGLVAEIAARLGDEVRLQSFVDSAPVYERALARKAGLGWSGKNANLIHKKHGSAFFIGGFFVDHLLGQKVEDAQSNHCGSCMICLEACPTGAILEAGKIDSGRCISYLTIESKEEAPPELHDKFQGWIFGCDICQEVCPWNAKKKGLVHRPFLPSTRQEWENMLQKGGGFQSRLKKTAMSRAGRRKLERNLKIFRKHSDSD